jgi:UDP-N-acetylmuramate dehydrogenase
MNLFSSLRGRVRTDIPLSKYTTFKVGGRAKFFIEPFDTQDLRRLLDISRKNNLKVFVIGQGSNLLVNDEGINGVVVKLTSPYFKRVKILNNFIYAGAGLKLNQLLNLCIKRYFSGLEFLAGIPGSLGGALVMNAGTKDTFIGERVKEVEVMDYEGNIKKLNSQDITFDYRCSNLDRFIILGALLKLEKGSRKDILNRIEYFKNYRKLTQELSYPNAGCIFKNPKGFSAAHLIDSCGLKGKSIGDAQVSLRHANFIINRGKAKATDILRLIDYIQKAVKRRFNINLELEIRVW